MSTIQVSISTASQTVVLDIEPSKTIEQVKKLVKEQDPSIETSNLIFEDKPLDDNKTLADYNITSNATLKAEHSAERDSTVVSPASSTTTPKKKKNRCTFKSCLSAPLRGVGDCRFCEGRFCSKHRLLEQHNCEGLHNCKQQMHERNAVRLQQQQTTASKV